MTSLPSILLPIWRKDRTAFGAAQQPANRARHSLSGEGGSPKGLAITLPTSVYPPVRDPMKLR